MIRAATPADAAVFAAIHARSFDDGWSEAELAEWLARSGAIAYAAPRDRLAIAFGLALTAGDDAEILTIATEPSARRQGHGRAILAEIIAEAGRRGLSRVVLDVARNNLAALGLYVSQGFVEIGVRKTYYRTADGLVDAIVLARPLA
jgi:ribosomal-protein-alanine N-acetyltransferase